MKNCREENNVRASSSTTPTEVPQVSSVFDNFASRNLELSNISEEDRRIIRRLRIRGPPDIRMMNEVDDQSISVDEKEDTSVSNQVDPDEVNLSIIRCPVCDFDIEVSTRRDRSVDYDVYNMICPVCDESLGEDAIRMVQNSSFPISQKWIWKPRKKNGVKNVHWAMHDKKDACREQNKHEQMPDSISPASRDNVYLPRLNDILSDEEDTINNASDVVVAEDTSIAKSIGTDATDTSDELDVKERGNRAAFSQELLISTLFLE